MELKGKDAETGEAKTGFIRGKGRGKFQCGNCVHMRVDSCTHPVMVEDSKIPRDTYGNPKVDKDDCCTYQRRPGD